MAKPSPWLAAATIATFPLIPKSISSVYRHRLHLHADRMPETTTLIEGAIPHRPAPLPELD
jgi:hypothetical protein